MSWPTIWPPQPPINLPTVPQASIAFPLPTTTTTQASTVIANTPNPSTETYTPMTPEQQYAIQQQNWQQWQIYQQQYAQWQAQYGEQVSNT